MGRHVLTSSGASTTAGWEAGGERSRPAENLGGATGRGLKPAAEGLGRTAGLAAAAAYELRWVARAEEVPALQEGSESSAAAAVGAATAEFSGALVTVTLEASSSAFERAALASASSFWTKKVPSTSTALAGPSDPWKTKRLALGLAHASANVKSATSACLMPLPSPGSAGSGSISESIIVHFCEAAPARERKTRREAGAGNVCRGARGAAVGTGCRLSKGGRTTMFFAPWQRVVSLRSFAERCDYLVLRSRVTAQRCCVISVALLSYSLQAVFV